MTQDLVAELDAFEGHAYAVTFSPDGRRLLVGGFGGLIRVYDTDSWDEIGQFIHHDKSTNSIVFAPDNETFAVSSSDRTISIWRMGESEPTAVLKGHRNTVMGLAWSPDGVRLASAATDATIRLWSPETPDTKPTTFKSPYRICSAVEFLPGGETMISAGGGDEAFVWSVGSQEVVAVLPGHGQAARAMQLTQDGKAVMTQGYDGAVRLWSTADWSLTDTFAIDSKSPRSVRLSSDGGRLAVLEERRVRVLALPSLDVQAEFPLPIKGVHLAAFTPDGNTLAVTAADGKARVWSLSMDSSAALRMT